MMILGRTIFSLLILCQIISGETVHDLEGTGRRSRAVSDDNLPLGTSVSPKLAFTADGLGNGRVSHLREGDLVHYYRPRLHHALLPSAVLCSISYYPVARGERHLPRGRIAIEAQDLEVLISPRGSRRYTSYITLYFKIADRGHGEIHCFKKRFGPEPFTLGDVREALRGSVNIEVEP